MLRVLVTRLEPGASETARRLKTLGFAPIVLPLSETRALPLDISKLRKDPDAVAVTSANALRHAPGTLLAMLAEKPCYAVGGKTADAARHAGLSHVIEGPGDAAGLADMLAGSGATSVVYLCGRVRLSAFEASLAKAGVQIIPIETYDTVETKVDSDLAAQPGPDIALLHSALSAVTLMKMAGNSQVGHLFAETIFLCLSERIASIVGQAGRTKIRVAAEPTEEALLLLLSEQS